MGGGDNGESYHYSSSKKGNDLSSHLFAFQGAHSALDSIRMVYFTSDGVAYCRRWMPKMHSEPLIGTELKAHKLKLMFLDTLRDCLRITSRKGLSDMGRLIYNAYFSCASLAARTPDCRLYGSLNRIYYSIVPNKMRVMKFRHERVDSSR